MKFFKDHIVIVLGLIVLAAGIATAANLNTSGQCPSWTTCNIGESNTTAVTLTADTGVQIHNTDTGVVTLDLRDYADTDDDDMAHALFSTNCTTATTGAEECDLNVSITTAGANVEVLAIDPAGKIEIGDVSTTDIDLVTDAASIFVSGAGTFDFNALGTNTTTLIGSDDSGASNLIIDTGTTGTIVIGSADVASMTSPMNDFGWSVVAGAETACTTTCTSACVFGVNTAATEADIVDCADATADECLCAGAS